MQLTDGIENLINELPQASSQRIEEIVSILEDALSDVECKYPTEDDTNEAYECQYIPQALHLIAQIKEWNKSKNERIETLCELSDDLKTILEQIPIVNNDKCQVV